MKKPAAHIALVLFARAAPEEVYHKNLLPGWPAIRQEPVFEAFNRNSLALLAATGLPYFLISSDKQKGNTFGQKLYQALAQTFAQGFDQVIVVGNDCPQLTAADLHQAAGLLNDHDTVLGPCQKGGVYLLGLNKQVFEKAGNFEQIPWQTPRVKETLIAFFQQRQTSIVCLATYSDINTPQDFRRARQNNWFSPSLRARINQLVTQLPPKLCYPSFLLLPIQHLPASRFRGPPSLIF